MTVQDHFTKYTWLRPLKNKFGLEVAKVLMEILVLDMVKLSVVVLTTQNVQHKGARVNRQRLHVALNVMESHPIRIVLTTKIFIKKLMKMWKRKLLKNQTSKL